jgi:hypothetical protein
MQPWAWQGIVTSIVAAVLFAVGATVLTWVRNKWPKYGSLALYWVATAACLSILSFALTGYVPFASHPPQVTADNIENNIKLWSENLGLAFTNAPIPDSYFGYRITTGSGNQIQVSRSTKQKPAYLQLAATLAVSLEHQAILGTLKKDQIETMMQEITLEVSKKGLGFAIASSVIPQTGTNSIGQTVMVFQKGISIASLSETSFASSIDEMESTIVLARVATQLALKRVTRPRSAF